MTVLRACAFAVTLAGLLSGPRAPGAAAQEPAASPAFPSTTADPTKPHKSVYGKLTVVDKALGGLAMKTDGGERLAWRFHPRVLEEAAKFKVGDPVIVIYRQIASNEKRVTAVAFPGSAATPIYVNTTGSRVIVRSAPMVDGTCGHEDAAPVTESTIPAGGIAEVLQPCWCCAVVGEGCTPGNKSGQGRALLVSCFK
jgi:hypothetical protein